MPINTREKEDRERKKLFICHQTLFFGRKEQQCWRSGSAQLYGTERRRNLDRQHCKDNRDKKDKDMVFHHGWVHHVQQHVLQEVASVPAPRLEYIYTYRMSRFIHSSAALLRTVHRITIQWPTILLHTVFKWTITISTTDALHYPTSSWYMFHLPYSILSTSWCLSHRAQYDDRNGSAASFKSREHNYKHCMG